MLSFAKPTTYCHSVDQVFCHYLFLSHWLKGWNDLVWICFVTNPMSSHIHRLLTRRKPELNEWTLVWPPVSKIRAIQTKLILNVLVFLNFIQIKVGCNKRFSIWQKKWLTNMKKIVWITFSSNGWFYGGIN